TMATSKSGQKLGARNRAPRVQIEYDVEIYGAERTIQLPFVMGVMSDLAGKSREAQHEIGERQFMSVDLDNFDDRMKSIRPRAAFHVPNTLSGDGQLAVDIEFDSMEDFSPASVARKVGALNELLEARTQLANLLTYMDGKAGAEELISEVLRNPALLDALAAQAKPAVDEPQEIGRASCRERG